MLSVKQAQETEFKASETSSLVRRLVDLEILYLLTFSPRSGYELKKQLLSCFKINVSYGTLYPHLHSLEKTGYVNGKQHQKYESAPLKKRIYSLTSAGKEILRGSIENLTKIALTMQFMMTRVNMGAHFPPVSDNKEALALVESFFVDHDYTVKKSVSARGFSGSEYLVDILAKNDGANIPSILLRMLNNGTITIDDILKTHVMSFDLEASRSIILTASTITEDISKIAEFYRISLYSGEDLEHAARAMCSSYNL
ncbi:MAG: PadR family transcriptional regulator [Nitrososphaerota archaeon]|jgi:DNA-binding PadR family transcriptional regulator|nr:PadR family transcriptional regulator [Nitrososphaerota archaeon]